jgi:tRNA pseudouridine38/39 synthase
MKQAAEKFKGEHDFRNFCYMDVANGVVQFFRRINNISFNQLDDANDM